MCHTVWQLNGTYWSLPRQSRNTIQFNYHYSSPFIIFSLVINTFSCTRIIQYSCCNPYTERNELDFRRKLLFDLNWKSLRTILVAYTFFNYKTWHCSLFRQWAFERIQLMSQAAAFENNFKFQIKRLIFLQWFLLHHKNSCLDHRPC